MKIVGIIFGLLTALCAFNAIADFRAAFSMRKYPCKVVASKLKVDYGKPDSESKEQPLYILSVDFASTEGSNRTFHWEGDPGDAMYPEEALDELARLAPGTTHTLAVLRGNAREIRFDDMESNDEINKAIAWTIGVFFMGITTLAVFVANESRRIGPWTVFVGFGLMPLTGAIPVGWYGFERMTTWQKVVPVSISESLPFDLTQPIANVEFTNQARIELPKISYRRFEFASNGRILHGGLGDLRGPYDSIASQVNEGFFVNPKNRWATASKLSWSEDFGVPFGILMFFGLAFTGAGLLIKKLGM